MALRLFAYYSSPTGMMRFLEDESSSSKSIKVQVPGIEHLVPLQLSEMDCREAIPLNSTASKVEQLLSNRLFVPIYDNSLNEVRFEPAPIDGNHWDKVAEFDCSESGWICRSNGTISYAKFNTVLTQNWITGSCEEKDYGEEVRITALSEGADGSLIAGDRDGRLYWNGTVFDTGRGQPIKNISPLPPSHCLVGFEDGSSIIADYKEQKTVRDLRSPKDCFALKSSVIVLDESQLFCYQFPVDPNDMPIRYGYPTVEAVKKISPTQFLIFYPDKCVDIRNEGSPKVYRICDQNSTIYDELKGNDVVPLDHENVFINTSYQPNKPLITTILKGKNAKQTLPGRWSIRNMISLSDGKIMYATDTRGATLYVTNRKGGVIFGEDIEKLIGKDSIVKTLSELVDGSVAIHVENTIYILKLRINRLGEADYKTAKKALARKHKIEEKKLEIEYQPDNLSLYKELVLLHEEDFNEEKQYQTCVLGLQAAMRASNLYEARRFYKQARRINAANPEASQLFLSYLRTSSHQKLARQIQLDLFAITKEQSDLPQKKEYKERLLIGEGDFSYTEALIKKHQESHPNLGKALTATEYAPIENPKVRERVEALKAKGVKIRQEVDGCKLHEIFKGQTFKRIQWNCPFGDSKKREEFRKVIPEFFKSCAQLQPIKGRVHVTLMQEKGNDYWKIRQIENPIVRGATAANYRLIRKRGFGTRRYPGYQHVKTDGAMARLPDEKREFIFEKVAPKSSKKDDPMDLQESREKEYQVEYSDNAKMELDDACYVCSTDDDTSDYYESS